LATCATRKRLTQFKAPFAFGFKTDLVSVSSVSSSYRGFPTRRPLELFALPASFARSADWQSEIQQVGNLRYEAAQAGQVFRGAAE
jgi:hypothetical protein